AMIDQYGADTCRLFMMFASPPDMSLEWSDSGVEGAQRFLRRVWRLAQQHITDGLPGALDITSLNDAQKQVRRATHLAIRQARQDIGQHHKFNTAIAAVVTRMTVLEKAPRDSEQGRAVRQEGLQPVTLALAPTPRLPARTLWRGLGHAPRGVHGPGPQLDEGARVQDRVALVIQVNGKLRGHVQVPADASREDVETA